MGGPTKSIIRGLSSAAGFDGFKDCLEVTIGEDEQAIIKNVAVKR